MERLVGRRRCGRAGKLRWHGQTPGESSSVEFTSEDENGKRKSGKVEKIRWTARCAPLMRMRSGGTFVFYPRHVDTDPQRDGTHNWPTHICPPCLSITHLPSPRRIYLHPYTPLYPSHLYDLYISFVRIIVWQIKISLRVSRINLLGCYIFPTRENYLYLISSD